MREQSNSQSLYSYIIGTEKEVPMTLTVFVVSLFLIEMSKIQTGQCVKTFNCLSWTRTRDQSVNSRPLYQTELRDKKRRDPNGHGPK